MENRQANNIIKCLSLDLIAGCEYQVDQRFAVPHQQLNHILAPSQGIKGVQSNNITGRQILRDQEGGTVVAEIDGAGAGPYWAWSVVMAQAEEKGRTQHNYTGSLLSMPFPGGNQWRTMWAQSQCYFQSQDVQHLPTQAFISWQQFAHGSRRDLMSC